MKNLIILLFIFSSISASQAQILKKPIPDKLVVLTFDDAPASQYAVVAPLLQEFGFGGTFFVCEFQPNYADSSLYMNWRQIQALDRMGFEIANHTHTHANVSKLTQKEFNKQLSYIEEKCDSLGIDKPTNFAYPGYGLNAQALEFLQEKEYVFARAGGSRAYDPFSDHPYLIPSWATEETNQREIIKAFGQAKDGKIVILTIHGVPDIEHPWVNTPPQLFKEYLQYLDANDFTVISMKDLEDYIDVEAAKKSIIPDFSRKLSN
ncbi:polysaccharide deacetylase family protein [Algoriphagus sp. C2-6-M1]|uniref:polysaccharide deacetylase family protein n=1 Tax=Algoriphagus persicinus TaxID=3108754 RepID=UPI002B383C5E|nr:polysaccharide deacetylase family protein [Algoriphagus sp. C2-6-M1]MEB2780891.1 polysaccharide deacetylase family protein [Algoriphagus sp. C2-6-M1]